ncbi:glucose-1-phosphate cytidylyltransferase [Alphaproteobacteria bacterium]|nr:glucose-1-phosphate cytidylyltransferase [Alphaproteobacteria bacterium]
MKVAIFAGGLGTRLGEETSVIPKPMIRIGEYPVIWHIMKIYSHFGFNDFVVLCGYKNEVVKDYFMNYYMNNSDITIDYEDNSVEIHKKNSEKWKVTLVDTGINSMTGARLKKARSFLENDQFFLTYGDGVSDVNIKDLLEAHEKSGKILTLTAIQPEGRFGVLKIDENLVTSFGEKKDTIDSWINGGFFVVNPEIFDHIPDGKDTIFEQTTLNGLAEHGQLNAYKHNGFWHCMDTLKDKNDLNALWHSRKAPWKIWEE